MVSNEIWTLSKSCNDLIILTGAKQGPKAVELIQILKDNNIKAGFLHGPSIWVHPYTEYYALDNDCFTNSKIPDWWKTTGEYNWLKMLDKIKYPPMFAVLPDVVSNWGETVSRAQKYIPELRSRDIPVAIALQDGCSLEAASMLSPDWFFIGGSKPWKWANVESITEFGKNNFNIKTHVGRVNGEVKIRECIRVGAHSCDGTGLARFQNNMLPRTIAAFQTKSQLRLF